MISWKDSGIVLSTRPHGEKYKIVCVLTQSHGKVYALAYKSKTQTFTNFAKIEITYTSREPGSLGFWKLLSETPTWIASIHLGNHLMVCQSICFMLDKLLPQNSDEEQIFQLTDYISTNLQNFSAEEILFLYVYFELSLLTNIGFSVNISSIQTVDNCSDIPSLISSTHFQQNAYRLLQTSSQIIAKNLTSIENFYRSSITKQLSAFPCPS
ncbi:MAG: recombination protein O N-terminal domain-containing protein [Alphaproteobacteria bacterium]|nr:recombination protein O N-terminal domain-containing protein [Alphaproteobacteria bacterium]